MASSSIILYACHRQIWLSLITSPSIRDPITSRTIPDIGRSSRFIHCLISDRGYFHYLVYRCRTSELKQTIFTTDGSTYKCRNPAETAAPHWHMATDGYFHLQVSPSPVRADTLIGKQHAHDKHDQIHFHLFH